jgi:lipoprotein-anchoring transpeptidase ErfK/SrfK
MSNQINRRAFLASGIALAATSNVALAETVGAIRYNFNSAFSSGSSSRRRSSYKGKEIIRYRTHERPGTIIIDTSKRKLFYVMKNGKAISYGVGVGRRGFQWSGTARIGRKSEWPGWHPPKEMIERERRNGRELPEYMPGGPNNPLGARALYLFQGRKDTLYRIHGTNQPDTIGTAASSGCIRMMNEEVIDLYRRVPMGAKVIVI